MKKLTLALLVMFVFAGSSFAQTADEVVNSYITAVGGLDKINSVNTVKMTGKFSSGSFEVPFVRYYKRPFKMKMDMQIQGMTMLQGYDGTMGWMLNPFQGSRDAEKMSEADSKSLKENADFEGALINYKAKGSTLEYVGKEDFEGTEVHKLKLTNSDGEVTYSYIDASNNLLLKESTTRKIGEKEVKSDVIYGNYKAVEGYMMPFSAEIIAPDAGMGSSQKVVIETVELNPAVDDAIFIMPEKK